MRSIPRWPATGDSTEVCEEQPRPATATTGRHGGLRVCLRRLLSPIPASLEEHFSMVPQSAQYGSQEEGHCGY